MKPPNGQPFTICNLLVLFSLCLFPSMNQAQVLQEIYREVPDDPYVAVDKTKMQRGPAHSAAANGYFTVQVNVDSDGNDILGDAANEPSIAVDPTNPNRMVIGWRQFDTISSNFREAGNGYSLDGGLTWTVSNIIEPGVFRSDPVLDFDRFGNFYYNSLSLIGGLSCEVFKITDGGVDWGASVSAKGGDRAWMTVDKTSGIGSGNNYSSWLLGYGICDPGTFTRSTDGSNTFEDCVTLNTNPFWNGTITVDGNGTVYILGFGGVLEGGDDLIIIKSTTAKDPSISPVTFEPQVYVKLDGQLGWYSPINPAGIMGQACVATDVTNVVGEGNVYALASVVRDSNDDPADVMFARSTDGGASFEPPIRINTDLSETNYQWFGTMSVAPNGRIDVAWLDTRDAPSGTNRSALYFTYSEDQGESWMINRRISDHFDPHIGYPQQEKMGDYFDMVSDDEGAHLTWANTINGGQDVYYTHITPSLLGVTEFTTENQMQLVCYPNPLIETTTISFLSKKREKIKLEIRDILGNRVATLLDQSVIGQQDIEWDGTTDQGTKLSPGLYFIQLRTNKISMVLKVLLE